MKKFPNPSIRPYIPGKAPRKPSQLSQLPPTIHLIGLSIMMLDIYLWGTTSAHQPSALERLDRRIHRREGRSSVRIVPRISFVIEAFTSAPTFDVCGSLIRVPQIGFQLAVSFRRCICFWKLGLVGSMDGDVMGVIDWFVSCPSIAEAVIDYRAVDEGDPET